MRPRRALTVPPPLASLVLAGALVGAPACDKREATEAEQATDVSAARYTVEAEQLDLEATVALLEREDVRDAESVEALLNADDSPIQLDVDKDGVRDFVSVHEVAEVRTASANAEAELSASETVEVAVEDGATARFELRVVPSSTLVQPAEVEAVVVAEAEQETVVVATLDFEVDVEAEAVVIEAAYAPVVVIAEDSHVERVHVHRVHIHGHREHHIVVAAPFVAWVWLGARPVYVGHHHLPPGHAKKLGLHWQHGPHHHGHPGPHHASSGHVKVKSHGGGKSQVKVKSHGGGKTQVKVKSHGGGKTQVKAKSHGGGKTRAKGKGKGK